MKGIVLVVLGVFAASCGSSSFAGSGGDLPEENVEELAPDAGPDAPLDGGRVEAPDAAVEPDVGVSVEADAGEASVPDAGPAEEAPDAGSVEIDAGAPDAGTPVELADAGSPIDADTSDPPDAGSPPAPGFTVEVTWSQAYGDVDLHLLGPGGAPFNTSSDCYKADCLTGHSAIDWGRNGSIGADGDHTNDPVYQGDVTWGLGPETIVDAAAFDATYTPAVSYYCSRWGAMGGTSWGAVTATIEVRRGDGRVIYTATQQLTQRDVWRPIAIVVSGGVATTAPLPIPPWPTPPIPELEKSAYVYAGCTSDTR